MRPRSSLVGALALSALACSGAGKQAPPAGPQDLLLITLDTARADRFSYAGSAVATPNVDALAAEGAVFSNAITPVPLTLPAHASLMTGHLPARHTVRDNGTFHLPEAEKTLAELLSGAGYATAAFLGSQVLDRRYGLARGFATYDDRMPDSRDAVFRFYAERPGEEVVASALRWMQAQPPDRPLFVWVHLFDPHAPYRPPEPERSRYSSGYDGEIAYTDRVVGRLIDGWEGRRGLARTVVVVTADHGEGLGEHGEATHGVLLHEATLRVPLVLRVPGMGKETIDAPVSLIDVFPTALALLGLPVPGGVEGRNLVPLLRGEEVDWKRTSGYAESLYAELHHGCAPLRALREGEWKLVRGTVDELYDLGKDPGENRDLANAEVQTSATLGEALRELEEQMGAPAPAERLPLDEETRDALASLGYVASGPAEPSGAPRDPRLALVSLRRMAEADRLALHGDPAGAIAAYREVIAGEPGSVDARFRMAQIMRASGRGNEAVRVLTEALALNPNEPFLYESLGDLLDRLRRHRESLAIYDAGLDRHPQARTLRNGRWKELHQLRRDGLVLQEAERAVLADPKDGAARYARALACCGQGSDADYRAALERELRELPGDPILQGALAKLGS
ncbi:MAG TPA: sulfatase-like hydrolase/transferase [Candidatus Polarisedimenticolaceae bacterium]|nr:sulfatase-like hydrolase/transferase [Candidatus Polarisedimenticolaceae bacterium]